MFDIGEKNIIAVTGSSGKTTVKTLISEVLREKWIVFESNDYNNTTEKTMEHKDRIAYIHRAAVLEYGMAYPGVITEHCRILRPNIGVITNVGSAHIGNFEGRVENLAMAKSELIEGLIPSGTLFLNADDENSKLLNTSNFKGKIFTVGVSSEAHYRAGDLGYLDEGMTFSVNIDNKKYIFEIPVFGNHNIYNALFAVGVAHQLGFPPEDIAKGLKNAKKPPHRLDIHRLKDNITVIDDTVHANPPAMRVALDVLATLGKKQKIAVLGSMAELGEMMDEYHEDVGRYLVSKNVDFLYTFGNVSLHIALGAIDMGYPINKVKHKTPLYRKVLHRELVDMIEPGSTILVKGASRLSMFETVKFLQDYYSQSS